MAKQSPAPTAASTREHRENAGDPPIRLVAEESDHVSAPSKRRGRPKGSADKSKTIITGSDRARMAGKAVKKTSKNAPSAKRGRPGRRPRTSAISIKPQRPGPENVYNDELKTTGNEWEVEEIVDSRVVTKKKVKTLEYLVKWVGYSNCTWEPEVNLRNASEAIKHFNKRFQAEA